MLAGHDITGGVVSTIVMIWLQVLLLPQPSVEIHVLVSVYSCGQSPPVVLLEYVTIGEGSQLSVEVAEPVAAGKVFVLHWIVTLGGHDTDGEMLSSSVMV